MNRPPHATEEEMQLIGSMLLDHAMIPAVAEILRGPEDFYSDQHSMMYRVLLDLDKRGSAGDLQAFIRAATDSGSLNDFGGIGYAVKCAESVPSPVAAARFAQTVRDKADLRRVMQAGETVADSIGREGADLTDVRGVIDRAERTMFEATRAAAAADVQKPLAQQLMDQIAEAEQRTPGVYSGVQSGIRQLDDLTGGWQRGDLVVIGARPSMGKTALCLQFMLEAAWRGFWTRDPESPMVPTVLFSMEMPREQILNRLICMRSGVCLHRFMRGGIREHEWEKLEKSAKFLSHLPLHIDDTPGLTAMQMRSRARRLVSEHGCGLILVDYIQLMRDQSAAKENRNAEVSAISRDLKQTARELRVPLIALSQLNRAVESRSEYRPKMADLRDSGSIEQDADAIGFLHRLEYYHRDDPAWLDSNYDKQGLAELIVAKNRNGPTETVKMEFKAETVTFGNWNR